MAGERMTPTLYRVAVTSLIVATLANVLLWRVSAPGDTFAEIIAVASGASALVLMVSAFVARWRAEALLLNFVVWAANLIEFATEDSARWESRLRNSGFYAAFVILALGTYVGERVAHRTRTP